MKPQSKDFTTEQAILYLAKRLNTKVVNLQLSNNNTRFKVKRLSTLKRLESIVRMDIFRSKYPNNDITINKENTHYWIDFWIKDNLVTAYWDEKNIK